MADKHPFDNPYAEDERPNWWRSQLRTVDEVQYITLEHFRRLDEMLNNPSPLVEYLTRTRRSGRV